MSEQVATATVPLEKVDEPTDTKSKRQPPYHVILWNDDDHSYEYVIVMLMKVFGYPQ